MNWEYNDGGRSKYFKSKYVGDCFTRAVAIAMDYDYKEMYNLINSYCREERPSKYRKDQSSARNGVYSGMAKKIMKSLGWEYYSYRDGYGMIHLNEDELPMGTIVCKLARHVTCVKDHVIYDIYNPSDKSIDFMCDNPHKKHVNHKDRCVYGYWYKKEGK